MKLRDATENDFGVILDLNEESVHFLSPLDRNRLKALHHEAEQHLVVERDGDVIAFMLVFREGANYDSPNYVWFDAAYDRFLYVDRIVVAGSAHGSGAGSLLYTALFDYARKSGVSRLACEVDIDPPNPVSTRFHRKLGFQEIGQQRVAGGKKVVSLQVAEVPRG